MHCAGFSLSMEQNRKKQLSYWKLEIDTKSNQATKSAGLAGVSSEMGLDEGLLVCTLLLLI